MMMIHITRLEQIVCQKRDPVFAVAKASARTPLDIEYRIATDACSETMCIGLLETRSYNELS